MIDTHDINKEKYIYEQKQLKENDSDVKSTPNIFGVSKGIKKKQRIKIQQIHDGTKRNGISWVDKLERKGRKIPK